jgi:glycosyltransferase involved in cell wall biosynthesis
MKRGGIAAIMWTQHSPHLEEWARRLDATAYTIHYLGRNHLWLAPFKYIPQAFTTLYVLLRQRPACVHIVNTPVFAPLVVYLYCRLAGVPYVMDVHGHSLISWKWMWAIPLQRFLARRALANIVDKKPHRELFVSWGAKIVELERPPVDIPAQASTEGHADTAAFSITVINTFAEDEPLDVVLDAAHQLPEVQFYVLGNTERAAPALLARAPENVTFTGYIRGDAFWQRLQASDAIMTLTTTPYSLTSGGIEAMALGKPLLVSRQPALVEYFSQGTVFIDHTVDSVVSQIHTLRADFARLSQEMNTLATAKRQRWNTEFTHLTGMIEEATCHHTYHIA